MLKMSTNGFFKGAAKPPTDKNDQDGLFFFNHPERGGLLRRLGARAASVTALYCCLDTINRKKRQAKLQYFITFSDLSRNTRAPHFTPQHWLLCHMGLY